MKRMSIKAYALKHKLSLFNVIKMTKSNDLNTEVIEENGKEVVFILIDEAQEKEVESKIVASREKEPSHLRKENMKLKAEILKLKEEIKTLKKQS